MAKEVTGGIIFDNVAISANTRSEIVNISKGKTVCFDVTTTDDSSLVGTIQVDVCNKYLANAVESANWQPVTLSTGANTIAISGTQGEIIDLEDMGSKYATVYFISTSGSGYINAYAHVKDK